jgi:hypothetical protein
VRITRLALELQQFRGVFGASVFLPSIDPVPHSSGPNLVSFR